MDMARCESCGTKTKEHMNVVDGVIICHSCNTKSVADILYSLMEEQPDLLPSISFRRTVSGV